MKVAILEPIDREGKLSYSQKLMLRSNLAKAVTNTAGYEAYDRSDVDAIMGEQDFQRTGMVSDDQIRKLGEMTGVSYILVSEGALTEDKKMIVAVKLLNVETARVEMTDNAIMNTSTEDMQRGCKTLAANLFGSSAVHARKNAAAPKNTAKENTKKNGKSVIIQDDDALYAIKKISNKEYQYMGKYMDKNEYIALLKNCPKAYAYYKNGKTLSNAGWATMTVGTVLTVGGAIMLRISDDNLATNYNTTYEQRVALRDGGIALLSTGPVVMTCVSIPLLYVGYHRQHNAHKQYNKYCGDTRNTPLSLNLTAGQNGLGLALHF